MAKYKSGPYRSITRPILKDLVKQVKSTLKIHNPDLFKQQSEQPANLYQDAGSRYNSKFVFPQL
jgi:hypothetical protein